MTITSERLRKLRQEHGITQEAFADILNVKTSTVSGYESGYRNIDIEKLNIICNYFNVPADYLLGITDTKERANININIDLGLEDKAIEVLKKFKRSASSDPDLWFFHQQYLDVVNLFLSDDDLKFFRSVFDYAYARYSIDYFPYTNIEQIEQDAKLYEWQMIKNLNEYVSKLSQSLVNKKVIEPQCIKESEEEESEE